MTHKNQCMIKHDMMIAQYLYYCSVMERKNENDYFKKLSVSSGLFAHKYNIIKYLLTF